MSDFTIKRTCPLCKHAVFMSPTTGQIKQHPRIPGQWCTVTELRVTITRKAKNLKRQPTRKSQKNQEAKRNADLVRSHTEAWVRSVFSHARCPSCDRVVPFHGTRDAPVFAEHWKVFSQAERCVQSGEPVPRKAIGVHGRKRPDGTFNCGLCGLLVSGRVDKPAPHWVAGAQRWCRAGGQPTSRGSVFTLSAGLPSLGKRR